MQLSHVYQLLLPVALGTIAVSAGDALPRNVRVSGRNFVTRAGSPILLAGPNVVVKGPPYLPSVEGNEVCNDIENSSCRSSGTCKSCFTFNQADVDHIKRQGWNTIRLGVMWAGAQPRNENALDPDFLRRLHAILDLTDRNGIHVLLDNHGDQVGSAGCGNGVPMWVQKLAAPELIGKELTTDFPYSMFEPITKVKGYETCAGNATAWALHAGDPNYNLLNPCCQAMNSPNPGGLGFTSISQKTMDYVLGLSQSEGRDYFVRYWRLLAEAVKDHPSAFGVEPMNEPFTIRRWEMFDTWRAISEAVTAVIPDMSVAICDVGEGTFIPDQMSKYIGGLLPVQTTQWIKSSNNVFYAWHWYGYPSDPEDAFTMVEQIATGWGVPLFATEFMDCRIWNGAVKRGMAHTYWHYSSYCNTGPAYRNTPNAGTFGACILGWGGGSSSTCGSNDGGNKTPTPIPAIKCLPKGTRCTTALKFRVQAPCESCCNSYEWSFKDFGDVCA